MSEGRKGLADVVIAISNRPLFWLVLLAAILIVSGVFTLADVLDAATKMIHAVRGTGG